VAIEGDRSIWAADPFGTELLELTVGKPRRLLVE
jgi:hypothetical protein